ncbi:MAG: hypothetical protein HYU05_00535 [Candidatus Wildermuthbacteria bacterium]|nr:hypothetical protein [Candidatus Wildermuthbacteria bacterium]
MKRALFIILIVDVAALLVFVFALGLPLTRAIRRQAQSFADQRREFERLQDLKAELRKFTVFAEQNASGIAAVQDAFIDSSTPLAFMKFLERNAAAGAVKLVVTPGLAKKENKAAHASLEFQITGTGPYRGVMGMLKSMERAPFAVSLLSVSIQRAEGGVRFSAAIKGLVR